MYGMLIKSICTAIKYGLIIGLVGNVVAEDRKEMCREDLRLSSVHGFVKVKADSSPLRY